jgi:hypothetical protein
VRWLYRDRNYIDIQEDLSRASPDTAPFACSIGFGQPSREQASVKGDVLHTPDKGQGEVWLCPPQQKDEHIKLV